MKNIFSKNAGKIFLMEIVLHESNILYNVWKCYLVNTQEKQIYYEVFQDKHTECVRFLNSETNESKILLWSLGNGQEDITNITETILTDLKKRGLTPAFPWIDSK